MSDVSNQRPPATLKIIASSLCIALNGHRKCCSPFTLHGPSGPLCRTSEQDDFPRFTRCGCYIEATRHTTYDRAMALIASIARNETYIEVHATANCYCKCRVMTVDTLQLNCRRILKEAAREGGPEKAFRWM
ncbi:unnamed protein product [Penicillium nalgiovense]|jgi:hypothetical protein|uniref:Uncharacterized protein n=2 Tax=Penicillium TaxID=5073 RepID=A0A9W4HM18_PENNA|nr:unnamed protein product [Penicillium nalgiovense]CAG8004583.1 unnamed protein product [Penicillium nalgiovense]CAG8008625.1 unnamed protein product [Penicillium nalgiovense]CAG8011307.1 unnamed protein product [Penicillium nalgiovense]CAG8032246.1 unnamed protein product [Penicillium nalgiovense]